MKLSPHFTIEECCASNTAQSKGGEMLAQQLNPDSIVRANLLHTCSKTEIARVALDISFKITSGFRCLLLNRFIGSSDRSAHLKGLALDIVLSDANKIKNLRDLNLLLSTFGIDNADINNNFRLFLFCILNGQRMHIKQIVHEKGTYGKPDWIHIGYYQSTESYAGTKITIYNGTSYNHISFKEVLVRLL
jgi:hypothetical protein